MPDNVPLTLPAMGESVNEGTVARWVKQVGEAVSEGETVVEVTTDKVDVEVPAPASGTLAEILANEGDSVEIGATLGLIAPGSASANGESAGAPAPVQAAPAEAVDATTEESDASPGQGEAGTVEAAPVKGDGDAAVKTPTGEISPDSGPPGQVVEISLPAMGESVTEGTVSRWVKQAGDAVVQGESIVEVTTDKVDIEVPAPVSGILKEVVAEAGSTVEVGGILARIAEGAASEAGQAPQPAARTDRPEADPGTAGAAAESGDGTPDQPPAKAIAGTTAASGANGQTAAASPLARRAAALTGVDVARVRGSGPGGLVRRDDVRAGAAPPEAAAAPPSQSAPPVAEGEKAVLIRGPQAALVGYMEQSLGIPTATSFRTIPVALLEARRRELNGALASAREKTKVSFTHLVGFAIARAAAEMPQMTAHFARNPEAKPARVETGVHLGLAVDSHRKDGTRFLVVPVVKEAAGRDFASFHAEYERLIERARNNTLASEDLRGASLTLTNPGGIGTMASVPRLMPGQGCIVATGAIGIPPEYRHLGDEQVRQLGVGKVMTMTSTYDHRVIQGAESGEFLARIEALLGGADDFYSRIFDSLGLKPPSADLEIAKPVAAAAPTPAPAGATRAMLAAMQAATSLIKAHRTHGMLGAHLDPLGTPPVGDPAMEPETYHLTPEIMARIPADLLRVYVSGKSLAEVLPNLRKTYCGTLAFEIEHISDNEQRVWLREHIESGAYRLPFSQKEKLRLLQRLTKVDAMERYLRRTFLGQKTYSGEGIDMMVPMLEKLLAMVAEDGIGEVVMGMAHRGRLATVAHVVNRPYEALLQAFEKGELRQQVGVTVDDPTGDVKYHIGATGTYITDTGKAITVRLLPNPSHLEAVNGVVEGWTRAEQTRRNAPKIHVDPSAALPVLIHGDAAFPAQGVVPEVLNLQSLRGYSTGGTVHIISNNQVGFTTDPRDARSTRFASDLAKGFDIPIVHVNADDAEACITAVRFAYDYRRTYHRDVLIDLIGYRRFGHNETDEPSYTQPLMYQRIREHPTVREIFVRELIDQGLITEDEAQQLSDKVYAKLADAHKRVKASLTNSPEDDAVAPQSIPSPTDDLALTTGVSSATLAAINEQLLTVPDSFVLNSKLRKQMERRRTSVTEGAIDWGAAEALALGSLLLQGKAIRLTGQDTERGTFSHRHLVFHDEKTDGVWIPIQHLVGASAGFEVYNSPLSEVGCLAFEYGYSAADPDALVLWEAQFGDFANNAQMVIDQFIVASQAKWGLRSRLTLLLPHGYEGQGPEHSSARLERYLQLSAYGNIRVANCSTADQYFHLLRNQALSPMARPLVIMTPKSLLRARDASCTITDLVHGSFRTVIDDPLMSERRQQVRTLLLCSGKVYWDLVNHELRERASDLAIARVELLDPLPIERILEVLRRYPNLEDLIWVQEEPDNMGAWGHLQRPIGKRRPYEILWDYVGRPRRASPSEGFHGSHALEQERIVRAALTKSRAVQEFLAGNEVKRRTEHESSNPEPSDTVERTTRAAAASDAS